MRNAQWVSERDMLRVMYRGPAEELPELLDGTGSLDGPAEGSLDGMDLLDGPTEELSGQVLSSRAKNSISKMTKGRCDGPEGCPDVWNQKGSELERLGFNLCVVLPHVVVSLISEGNDRVGGQRSEIGDDFVERQKSDKDNKEEVPSHGVRRGLKERCSERTMSKISRDSN